MYYDQGRKMKIVTMCHECGHNVASENKVLWRGPINQIYSSFKGVLEVIKEEEGKTIRFGHAVIKARYTNLDTRKYLSFSSHYDITLLLIINLE
jgi:hypothetical protein